MLEHGFSHLPTHLGQGLPVCHLATHPEWELPVFLPGLPSSRLRISPLPLLSGLSWNSLALTLKDHAFWRSTLAIWALIWFYLFFDTVSYRVTLAGLGLAMLIDNASRELTEICLSPRH